MSSSTSTNLRDHQLWAMGPRVLRAFSPFSTGSGRDGGGNQLLTDRVLRQLEDLPQLAGGQFGEPALAVGDDQVGQGLLVLDHVVDLLFQGPGADELAH